MINIPFGGKNKAKETVIDLSLTETDIIFFFMSVSGKTSQWVILQAQSNHEWRNVLSGAAITNFITAGPHTAGEALRFIEENWL